MPAIGRLMRRARASDGASPLAATAFAATAPITITSPSFADGAPIPRRHAGPGVGENISPELHWAGVLTDAGQIVLLMDDVDVPLPKPLFHTIAVLEPTKTCLGEGEWLTGTEDVRIIRTLLSRDGYSGPRPIPGHGPHHYRFHVLALDRTLPETVTSAKPLLTATAGHVIARGMLNGTYER